ncbi:MAG: hypothetical protein DME25_04745 [Verrucomicrobia bacterium]|nr:MAG: hypothetical protein DME25_04745 [Verrucomicrobiota bacterium]
MLVAFVLFGFTPEPVDQISGGGDDGQIFLRVEVQTLENPGLLQEFALETKHSFFGWHLMFFLIRLAQSADC